MNCLIIEDEKVAAERLSGLIRKYDSSIEILNTIQSVKNTVKWLNENPTADLIFMDIQLADGLSFEIFEQTIVKTPVIFTTAYDEYALKAFKVNSIDYLLKPIDQSELNSAIEKYKENISSREIPTHVFDNILHSLTKNYKNKFVIKVGEHIKVFKINDVQCFYSMEKYSFLQTNAGRDYAISYSLDQLESLLDPVKFFRINRKFLVSFSAISDIISYSSSRLLVKLNSNKSKDLIVSREKVHDFKKWLES
ncbi:LytTR family DNA-binding domain-containing protein [Flavivirga abyssicola]|uniref:LytR/AlgR family response regulator transcription factor n=1 Tax=Flavivirga abyssicola TaxID=3063533 RepID=UPI0026DEF331|nr:LytTR family DNA-binding domain-containing protein [Flavivirga sp. MEBiC07777]WVK14239.1 LytTR family DNA-binding domain-containing protein [Flavivirga sp. MEBiC07777]